MPTRSVNGSLRRFSQHRAPTARSRTAARRRSDGTGTWSPEPAPTGLHSQFGNLPRGSDHHRTRSKVVPAGMGPRDPTLHRAGRGLCKPLRSTSRAAKPVPRRKCHGRAGVVGTVRVGHGPPPESPGTRRRRAAGVGTGVRKQEVKAASRGAGSASEGPLESPMRGAGTGKGARPFCGDRSSAVTEIRIRQIAAERQPRR